MFKQVLFSFSKAATAPKITMAPQRALMTMNKNTAMGVNFLARPSLMSFATSPNQTAAAAETPASHMHRTMALDRSITSFF